MASIENLNYPECVEDTDGILTLTGNGSNKYMRDNTASRCASRCREFKNIFSGTKDELCICGNEIKRGISVSRNCNMKCPGDKEETCGGKASLSLRRSGFSTLTSRSIEQKTSSKVIVTSLTSEIPVTSSQAEVPVTNLTPKIYVTSLPAKIPVTSSQSKIPETSLTPKISATSLPSKIPETSLTPKISVTSLPSKNPVTSLPSKIPVTSLPSKIPVTSLAEARFTNESTGTTTTVFRSHKACTFDSTEGTQMTALYITLPVVVIIAGAVCIIVCLILRYRRQKDEANGKRLLVSEGSSKYKQDSKLENYNYRFQGVEVTSQNTDVDDMCDADYSAVSDLNDTLENIQDYDELNAKQATGTKTHAIYSHLKLKTEIPNSNTTDNTYSHIGSASEVCINKTDNAYSTVQFSQRAENTGAPSLAHDEDQNSFYDTAKGQNKRRVDEMSEYSHINKITVLNEEVDKNNV